MSLNDHASKSIPIPFSALSRPTKRTVLDELGGDVRGPASGTKWGFTRIRSGGSAVSSSSRREVAHHYEQVDRSFPQIEHPLEPDGASDRNRLRKRPSIAAIPDTREWSPTHAELAYLTRRVGAGH